MNGSRLNEHRSKRIPTWHWLVGIGLLAAAVGYGTGIAKGEEFNENTGYTITGFSTCMANNGINEDSAKLLAVWIKLVEKVTAFEAGTGPALTDKEIQIGSLLEDSSICGELVGKFPITILETTHGYALFKFDPQLGWGSDSWLIYREGITVD